MGTESIVRIPPESPLFSDVLNLHKRNKKTLGFLPRQGFADRAAAGTLIACMGEDASVRGYALYDLPRSEIRLVHLAVAAVARGSGVARVLVDWITQEHADRRGLRLSCRRDFAANNMWPKLGFTALAERRGRGVDETVLVTWWLDLGHPTLFSFPALADDPLTSAAIDMNVFIDLVTHRPEGRASFALEEPWVSEDLELVLTDEVLNEIHRGHDASRRETHRRQATAFRRLRTKTSDWQAVARRLKSTLGGRRLSERDESDIRHLSRAAAGGASYFVTRDSDLIRRWQSMAALAAGIQIVQPHTLVQLIDQRRRESAYVPAQLEGTDLELRKLGSADIPRVLDPMILQSQGERARDLRRQLQEFLSNPSAVSVWLILDGDNPIALTAEEANGTTVNIPLLRVGRNALAHTIARQLLFRGKLLALSHRLGRVQIADPFLSEPVRVAMREELYEPSRQGWAFMPIRFVGSLTEFRRQLVKNRIHIAAWLKRSTSKANVDLQGSEVERRYWPAKVTNAPLETFVIPIRPQYAEALFDVRLAEGTLFTRARQLGLSRENVYYRSPKGRSTLAAPARLIWYVTSQAGVAGTGQVVACSRLEEIVTGSPRLLYQRYKHLGIYRLADVVRSASQDEVMALRFTDTELFTHRLDLGDLRRIAATEHMGLFLQGPWRITPSMFEKIYKSGTAA